MQIQQIILNSLAYIGLVVDFVFCVENPKLATFYEWVKCVTTNVFPMLKKNVQWPSTVTREEKQGKGTVTQHKKLCYKINTRWSAANFFKARAESNMVLVVFSSYRFILCLKYNKDHLDCFWNVNWADLATFG